MPRTPAQPLSFVPRGLSREEAAAYVGIGATLFDRAVADGKMPQPLRLYGRVLWDRARLDRAMEALQPDAEVDPYADFR